MSVHRILWLEKNSMSSLPSDSGGEQILVLSLLIHSLFHIFTLKNTLLGNYAVQQAHSKGHWFTNSLFHYFFYQFISLLLPPSIAFWIGIGTSYWNLSKLKCQVELKLVIIDIIPDITYFEFMSIEWMAFMQMLTQSFFLSFFLFLLDFSNVVNFDWVWVMLWNNSGRIQITIKKRLYEHVVWLSWRFLAVLGDAWGILERCLERWLKISTNDRRFFEGNWEMVETKLKRFMCYRCVPDRLFHSDGVLRYSDLLPRSGARPVPRSGRNDSDRPVGTHHERCRFRHHGRRPPHRYILHDHHRLDSVLLCRYFYRLTRFTMGRLQYLHHFLFVFIFIHYFDS